MRNFTAVGEVDRARPRSRSQATTAQPGERLARSAADEGSGRVRGSWSHSWSGSIAYGSSDAEPKGGMNKGEWSRILSPRIRGRKTRRAELMVCVGVAH